MVVSLAERKMNLESIARAVELLEADQAFPHEIVFDDPVMDSELVTHRVFFDGHHFVEPRFLPELELDLKRVARIHARDFGFPGARPRGKDFDPPPKPKKKDYRRDIPKRECNPYLLAIDLGWYLLSEGAKYIRKPDGELAFVFSKPENLAIVRHTAARIERNCRNAAECDRVCNKAARDIFENWPYPRSD